MNTKTIIITGANKGIGFEMARQLLRMKHAVILTARNAEKGKTAVEKLKQEGLEADFVALDITNGKSIQQAVAEVSSRTGRLMCS